MVYFRPYFLYFLFRSPLLTYQSEGLIPVNRGIRRQGVSYAHFAVHKFQCVQGSPLGSSREVDKFSDCALACLNNPSCFSFNLGLLLTAKGKLSCELLTDDKYRNASRILPSQQFYHYSIKVNILLLLRIPRTYNIVPSGGGLWMFVWGGWRVLNWSKEAEKTLS